MLGQCSQAQPKVPGMAKALEIKYILMHLELAEVIISVEDHRVCWLSCGCWSSSWGLVLKGVPWHLSSIVTAAFVSTLTGAYSSKTIRNYLYGICIWHIFCQRTSIKTGPFNKIWQFWSLVSTFPHIADKITLFKNDYTPIQQVGQVGNASDPDYYQIWQNPWFLYSSTSHSPTSTAQYQSVFLSWLSKTEQNWLVFLSWLSETELTKLGKLGKLGKTDWFYSVCWVCWVVL